MLIKIIVGDGWYRDMVGQEVEVREFERPYRESTSGERVLHYVSTERHTIPGTTLSRLKLIPCSHAEPVN